MIPDNETNFLYLADSLKKEKYSLFLMRFEKVLKDNNIHPEFLAKTRDIWAVDYMPIQIAIDKFIQFTYYPDYLNEYRDTMSNGDIICKAINRKTEKTELIVDGGNIVRSSDIVIMCDKVFHENKKVHKKDLIKQLKELFQVDKLFFVPWDTENDFTGHADGMVRFIDNKTVLINGHYSGEDSSFQTSLRMAINNAGLEYIELPYNPPIDPTFTSARGLYINYLQMEQTIIMPIFQSTFDEKALQILEDVFKGQTIATVESNEIAREGGVLNCITWNIKKEK